MFLDVSSQYCENSLKCIQHTNVGGLQSYKVWQMLLVKVYTGEIPHLAGLYFVDYIDAYQ